MAVDIDRAQGDAGGDPAEETGHLIRADYWFENRLDDAATVGQQRDVRREDVQQALQISGLDGSLEGAERVPGLGGRHDLAWPAGRDVTSGSMRDLANRRRLPVDGRGDLVVLEPEDITQYEDRSFGRAECFQDEEHRHRDALGQFDVLGDIGGGQQRLGQPRADVRLLAPAQRPQPGQRQPGGDPDQISPLMLHLVEIHRRPAQPRLLQNILRVRRRPEHLVRDGEQQIAMGNDYLSGRQGDLPTRSNHPTRRRPAPPCDKHRSCHPSLKPRPLLQAGGLHGVDQALLAGYEDHDGGDRRDHGGGEDEVPG